jgi:hypothetical protein
LQLGKGNNTCQEEVLNDVNAQEESFWEEVESNVNTHWPVGEDASHIPGQLLPTVHVICAWHGGNLMCADCQQACLLSLETTYLKLSHVLHDFEHVLADYQWIVHIFGIKVIPLIAIKISFHLHLVSICFQC